MSGIGKINGLKENSVRQEPEKVTEEKFREVSQLYEKHFIREMMKQMRSTVHEGGFIKQNNAEKIFRDQLDDQYADQWGKSGGIGLADIIHEQLMNKYGVKFGLKAAIEKPEGPIALTEKSKFSGVTQNGKTPPESLQSMVLQLQNNENERSEITSPWAGILLEKNYLDMDRIQFRIAHDNGLESTILAAGTGPGKEQNLAQGDKLRSGQQLGWAKSATPVVWSIRPSVSE